MQSRDQGKVQVELEGRGGEWRRLGAEPVEREVAPPLGMRREATAVVKERGIGYLLLHDGDFWAQDLAQRQRGWGVVLVGQRNGFQLYKIE